MTRVVDGVEVAPAADDTREVFERVAPADDVADFLTLVAYERLAD